jgi:uncharacterized protein (DUF1501 family)
VMQSLEDFTIGGKSSGYRSQLERLYAMERGQLGAAARDTFDALVRIDAMRATKYQPAHGAEYGRDEFANGLSQIARLIKADVGLEAVSIDLPGWDSHFAQQGQVENLAMRLAGGLSAFRQDLGPRMATTSVVVMTEFGRTVEENSGFGTDHGRGSAMFVLGGGVRGGRIHGAWRGLAPDALERRGVLDGYGDLPVLNNYRNVLAPVLARHGGDAATLTSVFPEFKLEPFALYG